MIWGTNLQRLNAFANWRFYFTAFSKFPYYQAAFNLTHKYRSGGSYKLEITITGLNIVYLEEVLITNCKLF
jgi:hypothetical protein